MITNNPEIKIPEKPLFILTVDTEEEWDWSGPFPRPPFSTNNIEQIPKFQRFCSELNVRPTYFVDYAVAENVEHADMLRSYFDSDECDIGAHLHPWATPPISENINEQNSHAVNLPLLLFEQKIRKLTNKLQSAFGKHPYSYRAGRWGVNANHLKILDQYGYRVDSSVRPFYRDQYFVYSNAPTTAYWPSPHNVILKNEASTPAGLLEVPATSGYTRPNFERLDRVHSSLSKAPMNKSHLVGILWHLGILRKITITPEGTDYKDVCRCIDASIKRGDKIINMFFHSSDLLPGCTQYVKTESEKTRFLTCIKYCVDHLHSKYDCKTTTMREIREILTGTA